MEWRWLKDTHILPVKRPNDIKFSGERSESAAARC
jgi:hypothetical protein